MSDTPKYPKGVVSISPNAIDWYPVRRKLKQRVAYCRMKNGSYIRMKRNFNKRGMTIAQSFMPVTPQHIKHIASTQILNGSGSKA